MHQTLVGRFRNPADAEVARNLLVADGIPVADITLRAHGDKLRRRAHRDRSSRSLLDGIENFFDHLFQPANRDGSRDHAHAEPVPPGGAVIVVTVDDGRKSRIACAALADMGATEIEAR